MSPKPMDPPSGSVEHVYRCYFSLIRAKCTRLLGDTHAAEDIAQETFVRLWRAGLGSAEAPRVSAWIYRTGTRLAIDLLRSRGRRVSEAGPEAIDHDTPEVLLVARRALSRLALQLSPEELEVAVLSRIDGLGQREIAEVLGRSERTVRRVLGRVNERLEELSEVAP